MHRFLLFSTLLPAMVVPFAAWAGTSVGVAVSVGQPGYYGQIELGGMPPPPVIYARPLVIQPAPVNVMVPPIYLRVPPDHYHHWHRYCGYYHACGRPVYFVTDGWYRHTYVPHYRHYPPKNVYRGYDGDRRNNQHYGHEGRDYR